MDKHEIGSWQEVPSSFEQNDVLEVQVLAMAKTRKEVVDYDHSSIGAA